MARLGYGGGDGGDDGYGGGGDGGDGVDTATIQFERFPDMRNGLKILSIGGGAYAYVLIGWVQRVDGDEYAIHNARCIRRFGTNVALTTLAEKGPQKPRDGSPTELLEAAARPEEIHRLLVRRAIPCNPKAWEKDCPKPADWVD